MSWVQSTMASETETEPPATGVYENMSAYMCTTAEEATQRLQRYGVAIVPHLLCEEECALLVSKQWDVLETLTAKFEVPIRRNDVTTWDSFSSLGGLHSMLLQHWGVGHAEASWYVRQHPAVVAFQANLHGCAPEQLVVSFDGMSMHLPPEFRNGKGCVEKTRSETHGLHTDCSYATTTTTTPIIQGYVTGTEARPGDATFAFLEGSHALHATCGAHFKLTDKADWHKLTLEQVRWYKEEHGCVERHVVCPAESMVLWNSKTIHCGREASIARAQPNVRHIVYVCYAPRSHLTEKQLERKRTVYKASRTTTHHPHKSALFAKIPRLYGKPVPNISPLPIPTLTPLGTRLAGF